MLELKESDIRAIAEDRYERNIGKRWLITCLVSLAVFMILALALPGKYDLCAMVPIIIMLVIWIRHFRGMARFEKAMIADWRRETGQEKPAE